MEKNRGQAKEKEEKFPPGSTITIAAGERPREYWGI
jgi:hypothetical protein